MTEPETRRPDADGASDDRAPASGNGAAPADCGAKETDRLIEIKLDPESLPSRSHPNARHEREIAIYDLLDDNSFGLEGRHDGPYRLLLGRLDDRLVFDVSNESGEQLVTHVFAISPLRRIIKDYFLVCESYYEAIKSAPPSKIQTIDMGRRGLHDEGSRLLSDRLNGKINIDHSTSRRLFTLICALYWKG
jgi:uncharacterized protein (UPF0262 family)